MNRSCDICGAVVHVDLNSDEPHEWVRWASRDDSFLLCGPCATAPTLAAKYKKALEVMRDKLITHLDNYHCCHCDLRWAGKDWRVCAHPSEECGSCLYGLLPAEDSDGEWGAI